MAEVTHGFEGAWRDTHKGRRHTRYAELVDADTLKKGDCYWDANPDRATYLCEVMAVDEIKDGTGRKRIKALDYKWNPMIEKPFESFEFSGTKVWKADLAAPAAAHSREWCQACYDLHPGAGWQPLYPRAGDLFGPCARHQKMKRDA